VAPLVFLVLTRGADLAASGIFGLINGAAAAGACYGAATGLALVWIAWVAPASQKSYAQPSDRSIRAA
jgi:hypothetical protein